MVFRPVVVPTPAIFVIVVWLWRTVAGLVRMVVRHPVACALVAGTGWLYSASEWLIVAAAWLAVVFAMVAWVLWSPRTWGRFVGWPLVSWARLVWVYRRRWRAVVAVTGLGRAVQGRWYGPDLVRVRCDAWSDRIRVRMLEGQSTQEWTDRADNLAHGFKARSCRVTVPRPGWVELVIPRGDVLADVVSVQPVPAVRVDAVAIGLREDGGPFKLKVHGTHVLIAGATGAGKGSFLWGIVRGLLPAAQAGVAQLWALDPKRMELAYGRGVFHAYASTAEECAELLEEAVRVMHERADRYAGVRRDHEATVTDPFIAVIVDEVAFLTAYQTDRGLKQRIAAALATLTTQGRAVGVGVIAALQDPRKEVLSLRNLFPDRIALRLDEAEQVDMVLGDGARDRGALADQIPRSESDPSVGAGEAYVRLENAPQPIRVRAAYVSNAEIKEMEAAFSMGES
ncbi:FtsK/SpoIIIE domain-containing protein [Spongiactinospora rosea]|uniref:FtsK/SpoIIIE domain-containing protein n=1 Tax=Spongiactinospora rosea TaxID=2248750 RepID=UPI001CEC1162|nr:FtsK/SpoIIIE domain-containing protein [Spongiactinospora rosea]